MIAAEEIRKAQMGDIGAIERLCAVTWEPLYRFVYHKTQNREEAEDVTQETYSKVLAYWREHPIPQDNLFGFLKTAALNVIRDRWRQRQRQGTPVNLEAIDPGAVAGSDQQDAVAQRLRLDNALAKLNEEQRVILDLRIVKGYPVAETARLTGKTEAAVRTAQYRALQALARLLAGDDE